jgi:hypothetical protein
MESGNRTADKMAKAYVENHPDSEVRRMYGHHVRSYRDGYIAASQQCEALQKFKAYVHDRLDKMGIPVDPESPHKAAGCRIGGRLDVVEALQSENTRLLERVKELETAHKLDLADAQFIGFHFGKREPSIIDMVACMGLTEDEWLRWKSDYTSSYLKESEIIEINEYYQKALNPKE